MTISINQIASGIGLLINDVVYFVMDYDHVKPGKGSAFVRVKLKNVKTGQVLEKTFRSSDKLEDITLEEKKIQNLYQSGDSFNFMDMNSYEEILISKDILGDDVKFLKDNLEVTAVCHGPNVLKVNLPNFIISEVKYTEPGFKGNTANAVTKPATIDTGATIQVPLFVEIGDYIKVDTRKGEYVERVKQ